MNSHPAVPAAGVALFRADGALLLGRHAHDGCWATFGGRVKTDESALDAARRELKEETGLDAPTLEPLGEFFGSPIYTVSYPGWGDTSYHVTMFVGIVEGNPAVCIDSREIVEARWVSFSQLAQLSLARDMAEIVPAAFTWWASRQEQGGGVVARSRTRRECARENPEAPAATRLASPE